MRLMTRALLGATAIACFAAPASAVKFNLIDASGTVKGTAAEKGFQDAADFWSYILTDDVVVNLEINFAALNPGTIGQAQSFAGTVGMASIYQQMAATGQTNLDAAKVLTPLSAAGGISMITSGYDNDATKIGIDVTKKVWDTDNTGNNTVARINTAVAKALGYAVAPTQLDGRITFSSNFAFDFDATNGIANNQMDFVSVAIHEIGHVLGFTSGVDIYDNPANVNNSAVNANAAGLFNTLDLFRYSQDPTNVAPGSNPVLDLAVGSNSYFSIDGGLTQFNGDSRFSTGRAFGDGQQASHFKDKGGCSMQIGIMDPNSCFGQMGEVTGADLAAFDAMGWNLRNDILRNRNFLVSTSTIQQRLVSGVPEPTTWAMLIAGFGMVGFTMRRSQRRQTKGEMALA